MLAVIVIMLTLALLAMSAAVPYVVTQIKRDREDELIHRGRAYSTAIKRFMKKNGRFPTTLKELENTGNVRFIRKLYPDPMSKTGEWRVIHYGEAKFFPKGFGFNSVSGLGGGTGGAILPGGVGSIMGTGGGPQSSGPGNAGGSGPQTAQAMGGMTPASDISKPLGSGPTFGGAPIIGVASTNKGESIHEVNERKRYNEWEFFYDPRFDIASQLNIGGAAPAGQGGNRGQGPGEGRK